MYGYMYDTMGGKRSRHHAPTTLVAQSRGREAWALAGEQRSLARFLLPEARVFAETERKRQHLHVYKSYQAARNQVLDTIGPLTRTRFHVVVWMPYASLAPTRADPNGADGVTAAAPRSSPTVLNTEPRSMLNGLCQRDHSDTRVSTDRCDIT
jgi:hypothetical protein